jgi:hypothetical protein
VHPAVDFDKITDAPFEGSPFCTEPRMHLGRPGKFTNLLVALAAWVILSSARAERNAGPTNIANTRQHVQMRMDVLLN